VNVYLLSALVASQQSVLVLMVKHVKHKKIAATRSSAFPSLASGAVIGLLQSDEESIGTVTAILKDKNTFKLFITWAFNGGPAFLLSSDQSVQVAQYKPTKDSSRTLDKYIITGDGTNTTLFFFSPSSHIHASFSFSHPLPLS